jgi:CheY-like chemotaxis protein
MPNGLNVLVIDDDTDYSESLKSLLEAEGFEVELAPSGASGLEAVRRRRPDLIVLDVMMESTTEGYAVTQELKFSDLFADSHDIPIIMVSSIELSPDERFPWAGELDMIRPNWYLTKPLDIPRFLEIVEKAVGRKLVRN